MKPVMIARWSGGPHHMAWQGNGITFCGILMSSYVQHLKVWAHGGDFNEVTCKNCRNIYFAKVEEELSLEIESWGVKEKDDR